MPQSYKYAIAQIESNLARGERLNCGIVVFDEDRLCVHGGKNLEKARAISGSLEPQIISQALDNLPEIDRILREQGKSTIDERCQLLTSLSPVRLTDVGTFTAASADAYDEMIQNLLMRLVEPEPAPPRKPRIKKTRLLTSLKSAFRSEKVLAKKGEGLESHRIVANEPMAEGLTADLALKNGAMHIVQTVDATHTDRARRAIQEIGISALLFEQAKIRFGGTHTKPRLVYAASSEMETAISAALHVAEHQGADLINWASRDDRTRFIVDLSSLAEPSLPQKRVDFGAVNASPRKNLN